MPILQNSYRWWISLWVLFDLSMQMYCNSSGYKKKKSDADLEDELSSKDMSGFEVDFV